MDLNKVSSPRYGAMPSRRFERSHSGPSQTQSSAVVQTALVPLSAGM